MLSPCLTLTFVKECMNQWILSECVHVCCCWCREDFDPDKFENKAALGLLQRFVSNGREADGSPTRDRLKLIVR